MHDNKPDYPGCVGEEMTDEDGMIDGLRESYGKKAEPMGEMLMATISELHRRCEETLKEMDIAAASQKKNEEFEKDMP